MKASKILLSGLMFVVSLLLFSCTDAKQARLGGYGDEFKVELIDCEGNATRKWISSGTVSKEGNAAGYYFLDKETQKLVRVMGTLVVTQQ
jgi:hypothetical protein